MEKMLLALLQKTAGKHKISLPAKKLEGLILLEPLRGFEPPTRALRMRFAVPELKRHVVQSALK